MAGYPGDAAGRGGIRGRVALWGAVGLLLLLPWLAMQVTDEVAWSPGDFALFGAMLAGACGAYELTTRLRGGRTYRAAVGLALFTAFVLVWLNLAVGVIGSEDNPANRMYGLVLAVGLAGAVLARLRADGMAHALLATAFAQALVAVVARVLGWSDALALTGIFVALWLASAWLFRRAARDDARVAQAS